MFFNMTLNELEKELIKTKTVLNNVRGESIGYPNQKTVKLTKTS